MFAGSWRRVTRQPQSDQDHPRSSGDCGDRRDQFQSQEGHSNSWSMDQQTAATHWTDTTTEGKIIISSIIPPYFFQCHAGIEM